jgi:predicted TIM-barrel fold metal-dependent hydrolase
VIVDVHTHIFPPDVIANRDHYLAVDPTLAALYTSPKARLATAEDLLRSMADAAIDVSVALGFAWSDPGTCRRHNDYLLEAASSSNGRIVPFCTLPLAAGAAAIAAEARRCAAAGAPGFGELRPDNLGFDLDGADGNLLANLASELDAVLLFHATEPVGHAYPGKEGLSLDALYGFIQTYPETRVIAAHLGGGLPFYALMPEVKLALENTAFDTAATSLLYAEDAYKRVIELVGSERLLFGSDFPLLSQASSRTRLEAALDPSARDLALGGNAVRLLRLA